MNHRDEPGQVVLLNGASSSGKSTLSRQLLRDFPRPWFHMAVDMFGAMRAEDQTYRLQPTALTEVLRRTRAGFHRAVAGMAIAGNDVVMDRVLSEAWRLQDLLTVMDGIDVVFVGVHCDPTELQRREAARGDRHPGAAVNHIQQVYAHGIYDVEVDTGTATTEDCSARIRQYLAEHLAPSVRAFDQLRRRQSPTT